MPATGLFAPAVGDEDSALRSFTRDPQSPGLVGEAGNAHSARLPQTLAAYPACVPASESARTRRCRLLAVCGISQRRVRADSEAGTQAGYAARVCGSRALCALPASPTRPGD